jgi:hypothetical protein
VAGRNYSINPLELWSRYGSIPYIMNYPFSGTSITSSGARGSLSSPFTSITVHSLWANNITRSFDRAKTHWEQKLAGQLITADALYLRDPIGTAIPNILHTPEKLLKLACLAEMCGQIEYAFEVLSYANAIVQDQDSVRRIIEQGGRYYVANKKRFYKQASLINSGFARRLLQSNLGKAIIKNNVGATTYRAARKLFFGW